MNAVKTFLCAMAVMSGGLLVACASDSPAEIGTEDGGAVDDAGLADTSTAYDAGKDTAPANVCIAKCTTDQECQSSCPAVANGTNCCDTATGVCFPYQTATCPAPQQNDSGTSTSGGYP